MKVYKRSRKSDIKVDDGVWLSLARAPGLGPGGRRFESCHPDFYKYARVAQLVERDLAKVEAAGSSPVSRSFYFQDLCGFRGIRDPLLVYITKITCGFYLKFSYYHPLPEHLKYFVLV